jgi:hypothetical protein
MRNVFQLTGMHASGDLLKCLIRLVFRHKIYCRWNRFDFKPEAFKQSIHLHSSYNGTVQLQHFTLSQPLTIGIFSSSELLTDAAVNTSVTRSKLNYMLRCHVVITGLPKHAANKFGQFQ